MKTTTVPVGQPKWVIVDAAGQSLGRLATRVSMVLRGKHRASFSPHQLCGDHVVVINAGKLALPPKKSIRKVYYRHTGHVGHLQVTRLDTMMRDKPARVIELAVKGMLPINRMRTALMKRLHVFADDRHPYEAQKPEALSLPS